MAVLRTPQEVAVAEDLVSGIGLAPLGLPSKYWDSLAALSTILRTSKPTDAVLDAGAELYSPILPWLAQYGYRHLLGCNLVFSQARQQGSIRYEYGDITALRYAPQSFAAISCLSVIEHGVDPDRFFAEVNRLLRPGGHLILSTDYWDTGVNTGDRKLFGQPFKIFDRAAAQALFDAAERAGLRATGNPALDCQEPVVRWEGFDYTFLLATFQKP